MSDINQVLVEKLIEENRLVNLPRTIVKYDKIVDEAIEQLSQESIYTVSTTLWIPKVVEESMIHKVTFNTRRGLYVRIKSSAELDSLIEIIDFDKIRKLGGDELYWKFRNKIISKSSKKSRRYVKHVPGKYVKALMFDVEIHENIECVPDIVPENLHDKVTLVVL